MRMAEYLERRGERQIDFATRAGISQQTVSDLVTGRHRRGVAAPIARKVVEATAGLVGLADLEPEEDTGAA